MSKTYKATAVAVNGWNVTPNLTIDGDYYPEESLFRDHELMFLFFTTEHPDGSVTIEGNKETLWEVEVHPESVPQEAQEGAHIELTEEELQLAA